MDRTRRTTSVARPHLGALVPNSRDPIDAEVERVLDHPSNYGFNIPNPGHTAQAPIYVVITPPGVTGGDVGFNEPSDAGTFGYHEVVWVSTRWINSNDPAQGIDQNFSEHGFSHEIVEAMTDPFGPLGGTHISKGANWPANDGNSQICDKEPDGSYYYRVGGPNGVLAQAFWSQNDGGFIVPDGNSLVMDLTGNWNGPNDFLYKCALTINTGQNGTPTAYAGNEQITMSTVPIAGGTGIQVVMDGETFDFEPGYISSIKINVNSQVNIDVDSLPSNTPLTINQPTAVEIGGASQTLANIQSNITIIPNPDEGAAGNVAALTLNDQNDTSPGTVTIAANGVTLPDGYTISGGTFTTINAYGAPKENIKINSTPSFEPADFSPPTIAIYSLAGSTVTVNKTGAGSQLTLNDLEDTHVQINGTGANSTLTINSQAADTISIAAAGIAGDASDNINANFGSDNLTINASSETSAHFAVAGDIITDGLNWLITDQAFTPSLTGSDLPYSQLTLDVGDGSQVRTSGDPFTVVPKGGGPVNLNWAGSLLNVDDSSDKTGTPLTITGNSVVYGPDKKPLATLVWVDANQMTVTSAPAPTSYSVLPTPTIDVEGLSLPTTIDAQGGCTVSVAAAAEDLDGVGSLLSVHGDGTTELTVDDQNAGAPNGDLSLVGPVQYSVTYKSLTRSMVLLNAAPGSKPVLEQPTDTINYSGLKRLVVNSSNMLSIVGLDTAPANTIIQAGTGQTIVNVSPTGQDLSAFGTDTLEVVGGGDTTLNIYDQDYTSTPDSGSSPPTVYDFEYYGLKRTTYPLGSAQAQMVEIDYSELAGLNFWSSPSPSQIDINGTPSGTATLTVQAGSPNDPITVGPPFNSAGGAVMGSVTINAQGSTLTIDNAAIPDSEKGAGPNGGTITTYDSVSDTTVTSQEVTLTDSATTKTTNPYNDGSPGDGVKPGRNHQPPPPTIAYIKYGATIDYSNVQSLTLNGSGEAVSTVNIQSTPAGVLVTANAAPDGANTFQVGNNGSVKGIKSSVTLNAKADSTVVVDDSQTTSQDEVTVGNGSNGDLAVGLGAADVFFGTGGSLTTTGMTKLTLKLSAADGDTATVFPSAETAFTIDGNATVYSQGGNPGTGAAVLALNMSDPPSFAAGSGTISFSNSSLQPITYVKMVPGKVSTATMSIGKSMKLSLLLDGQPVNENSPATPLTPGTHTLADADGNGQVSFDVSNDGIVSYDPSLQGVLLGDHTSSLTVQGAPITINATALGNTDIEIGDATYSSATPFIVNLLPGANVVASNSIGLSLAFSVAANGTVSYNSSENSQLSGSGTNTLVLAAPAAVKFELNAQALSLGSLLLDGDTAVDTQTPGSFTVKPGQHTLNDPYGSGSSLTFTVSVNGIVSYDPSLQGILVGAGSNTLVVQGLHCTLNATALTELGIFVDDNDLSTAAPLGMNLLPGPNALWNSAAAQIAFTVAAGTTNANGTVNGIVSYASSVQGILTGAGSNTLVVQGLHFALDATALNELGIIVDDNDLSTAAPLSMNLLPGPHALWNSATAQIAFTVAAGTTNANGTVNGIVSYDPSVQGILTGAGSNTLVVQGLHFTLDATALNELGIIVDDNDLSTAAPLSMNLLPGPHALWNSAAAQIAFTVAAGTTNANGTVNGIVSYGPSVQGILTGAGSNTLVVQGLHFTLDATALLGIVVDDNDLSTAAPLSMNLLPGPHALWNDDTDQIAFNLTAGTTNANGTVNGIVSYDPSLQGILTGAGSNTLTVNGVAVTINATALTSGYIVVNYFDEFQGQLFTVHLLPGTNYLWGPGGSAEALAFTVTAGGIVGYDSSLQGVLTGAGSNTLIVKGVSFTINATALGNSEIELDYAPLGTATSITVVVIPGVNDLYSYALNEGFVITVALNGDISYDPSLDNILSGAETNTLGIS